jgi:hypothetical protein
VANAVAIDPRGRILVAGCSQFTSTDHDFAVARQDANGNPDPFFGSGGKQTVAVDLGGGHPPVGRRAGPISLESSCT